MTESRPDIGLLAGPAALHRVAGRGFPSQELRDSRRWLARLGRDSSFGIFLGRGRRVVLPDGSEWRIKAATMARFIVPVIRSKLGTVAYAGPLDGKRSYGITGRDFAYNLVPLGRVGLIRPSVWVLRLHETDVASIDDRAHRIEPAQPLPLAAVLMAFTLIKHGIPGEGEMLSRWRPWG